MKITIRLAVTGCALAGMLVASAVAQSTATDATGSAAGSGETSGSSTTGSGSSAGSTLGSALGGITSQMENSVLKHGGKLYQVKEGRPQAVTAEMTLPNGTKVDQTGNVTMSDGRTMTLQDDQLLTPTGSISNAPKTLLNSLPGGGSGSGESSGAGGTSDGSSSPSAGGASSTGTGSSGTSGEAPTSAAGSSTSTEAGSR